ncbi:MAG: 4Fe-4S dicluster domain-containing protein [Pseudomonadota bacterium]
MKTVIIDKSDWERGVRQSAKFYCLSGPAPQGESLVFRELNPGELPVMDARQTHLSPKTEVFPQTEILFTFSRDPGELLFGPPREPQDRFPPRAVIGIRPYDAKALSLMRLNFETREYQDPYWISAFKACTLIGLAENAPGPANFSTSCGTGPFDESSLDVLLVDAGDAFLARVVTTKGEVWLETAGFETPAGEDAATVIRKFRDRAEASITSRVDFRALDSMETLDLYNREFWESGAFACINCGICAHVCPTCWCFDIQDETLGDRGCRLRIWDTCMSSLFSLHASGHNPRALGWQRMRNRFMHKLKYFPDKYNKGVMCVGCGRCVTACPVNIDIREIAGLMTLKGATL